MEYISAIKTNEIALKCTVLNDHQVTYLSETSKIKKQFRVSLVAQWLRIHLPMQETRVWALVREDPTCCRAAKLVRHNYWACVLEPASHNYWVHVPQLLKPMRLEPMLCNKRSHRNAKATHCNEE